jgi:diguanylate cyclase (GGDEF)-like protein
MHLRRHISTAGVWIVLLLSCPAARAIPVVPGPVVAESAGASLAAVLDQVNSLRKKDPAAALRLGEPAWQAGPPGSERNELGLALMAAAGAAEQPQMVLEIGERLQAAALTPAQRLHLFNFLTYYAWAAHDAARVKALEPGVSALEKQQPEKQQAIATLWQQIAASYTMLQDSADAMRTARLAIAKAPHPPNLVDYTAYQFIAMAYIRQGKMPEAIEAMLAADNAGKALKQPDDPTLLQNFSGLFMYTKDWRKAIEYGERAEAAATSPEQQQAILGNLGGAWQELHDYPRAEANYAKALRIARANKLAVPALLNNMADLLQQQNKPAQALPLLKEAAAQFEHDGAKASAATAWSNIGAALASLGQRQAAVPAFVRSLALFTAADDVARRLELYPRMIDNLAALGQYREALALMRDFKRLDDEHVTVASNTRVAKLESVIELERKNTQLARAAREHEKQQLALTQSQARQQRQQLITKAMLAALLLIAAVAAWSIRQSRIRQRLNRALSRKNVEIEAQHRDLVSLNATIRQQSEEDALTGLRNRRFGVAWLERLADAQLQARRSGAVPVPTLVMLLDIDHFKQVNDQHGHEAGDHALLHFADILRECSRQSDTLVRWGGEEFLWICEGSSIAEAESLFARVRERLQQAPLMLRGHEVAITVSMGFTRFPVWPQATGDWAFCLRMADAALYRAKTAGRDRWVGLVAGKAAAIPAQELCVREASAAELEARGCLALLTAASEHTAPTEPDAA